MYIIQFRQLRRARPVARIGAGDTDRIKQLHFEKSGHRDGQKR